VHHYELALKNVFADGTHYQIEIQNRITGAPLTIRVPIDGMHSEPITQETAVQIGETVAEALRQAPYLTESSYEARGRENGGQMSAE